jgi:hypothetical protein
LLGVFIGPTLLAVGYTLIREWSHTEELEAADSSIEDDDGPARVASKKLR